MECYYAHHTLRDEKQPRVINANQGLIWDFWDLSHRMPQQQRPGSLSAMCCGDTAPWTAAPAEHLSERFQSHTKVSSLCVLLEFPIAAEKTFSLHWGMLDKMVTYFNKTHYLIILVKIFDLDKLNFKHSYNYNFYNFFPILFPVIITLWCSSL